MKEIINFNLELNDLSKINPLVSRYKIFIAYADEPANNYIFSKDVLNSMSETIKGCPVVAGFMNNKDGSVLGGHEDDLAIDENNRVKPTPAPIPVGFAAYDIEPWWEEYKGKNYLTTFIYIWDGRYPELENLSEREIFHSMEVAVEENLQGKFKIVNEAYALGLCLLENVEPAFKNSHIEKFSYTENNIILEVDNLKHEFEQFSSKYDSIDFTIPEEVKKVTKLGLDLYKKYNKGGTSVSIANARFIQKNNKVTPEKAKSIAKYSSKIMKKEFNKDDESDPNWISFNLWGALDGYKWSTQIVESINKIDEEKLSYFTNRNNKEGDKVIKEAIEKFSLTARQIDEILNNALSEYKYKNGDNEYRKYWVRTFDDSLVYVCDYEDDKCYSFKYTIEDNIASIDIDSKDEVIDGGFMSVHKKSEESAEMAKEETNTEKSNKETEKEEMSSNEYVDNTAMQELNDKSAEDNKDLSEAQLEVEDDKDKIIAGMTTELSELKEKMSKMETDMAVYMKENGELKEFKANIEKQNKEFEVEMTLKEVMEVLPKEELDSCRMSAENFSLENISAWKNEVQAKAFKFSKGISEKKPYIQVGLPETDKVKTQKGLWD